jgi:hypothetical protein
MVRQSLIYRQIGSWLSTGAWGQLPEPVPEDFPWREVIRAASRHLVSPALGYRLRGCAWIPAPVSEYLAASWHLNSERNNQLLDGLEEMLDRLQARGIGAVALKGIGLIAGGIYPGIGLRFMADIDLLLAQDEVEEAQATLEAAGYRPTSGMPAGGHHLPPLIHPESGRGVELHRLTAVQPYHGIVEAGAVIANAERRLFRGGHVLIPSAEHRLTLAIVHGQLQDRLQNRLRLCLRMLCDAGLHRGDRTAWTAARTRLEAAGARWAVDEVEQACLAFENIGRPLPPRALRLLDSSSAMRRLRGTMAMIKRLPDLASRPPRQQLAALSRQRRIARRQHYFAKW